MAFIGNIHLLKKQFLEKIAHNVFAGEWEVVIGQGPAARTHRMDMSDPYCISSCKTRVSKRSA